METRTIRKVLTFGWSGVAVIGLLVVAVVVGLQLFPRLSAAQELIDDVRPALTADRVAGDAAGAAMISTAINVLDPAMHPTGQWSKLVTLLADRTGRSEAGMRDRLQRQFPFTASSFSSEPLYEVAAEVPEQMEWTAAHLGLTREQWDRMLADDFPALNQQVHNLPKMTDGWDSVPGTEKMTRFDGGPVRTMPQVRDYYLTDLIPAFDRQQANFAALDTRGGVGFLAPLLLGFGMVMILFGTLMATATRHGLPVGASRVGWVVVSIVGLAVVGLVFALNLYPRLSAGQRLLDDTRAAFTVDRVDGAAAGADFMLVTVNAMGPSVLREGGVSGEVIKLVVLLTEHTGIPPLEVKHLLLEKFPHASNLLLAAPFSEITAENSEFYDFLAANLDLPPGQGQRWLTENFPGVSQVLTNMADLTGRWAAVPGTENLTWFDGTPARSVPDITNYFIDDVIPVLVRQQTNLQLVDSTWPKMTVFAPLLTATGISVVGYGLTFYFLSRRSGRKPDESDSPRPELVEAVSG